MNKLVSVMIPVYNGAKFIEQAIDSVLKQDYDPIEIIVVNDGSTDNTSDVLEQYKDSINIVYQTNQGLGATRQRGIDEARGDYLALLDADDIWTPNAVRLRLEVLETNPDVQIVFGHQQYFFDDLIGDELKQRLKPNYVQQPIPSEIPSTVMFSRETFMQVGNFIPDRNVHPFLNWYARAKDKGFQSVILPDLILHRRLHNDNTSRLRTHAILPTTLKQILDRRRKQQELSDSN